MRRYFDFFRFVSLKPLPNLTMNDLLIFCSVKCLEEMKNQWDQFGNAYETFSIWISDKEKQLEVLKSSALPLEQQISAVKVQHLSSVSGATSMATALWLKRCLVHPGCCCRASRSGGGSRTAGGRFPEPGPVCVIRGGGSYQGPADPDRQVLGGVKGERPAAGWTA